MLHTHSGVVESFSHLKDQNNQLTSLEKQEVTDQPKKVSNQYQNNHHQNHRQDNKHQNHRHNNNQKANIKLMMILANEFRNNLSKQTDKRNKLVKNFMWVT